MADLEKSLPLERSSVLAAHELIKPHIHLTPVLTSKTLSTLASTPQTPEALANTPYAGRTPTKPHIKFFFKCENFQRIGAFKIRGAFHALMRLTAEERARGVVTTSSGAFCSFLLCFYSACWSTWANVLISTLRKSCTSPRPCCTNI